MLRRKQLMPESLVKDRVCVQTIIKFRVLPAPNYDLILSASLEFPMVGRVIPNAPNHAPNHPLSNHPKTHQYA